MKISYNKGRYFRLLNLLKREEAAQEASTYRKSYFLPTLMTQRIPWDHYFISQSLVLATRSTCQRAMVGAVIVRDKRMIAGGYNGSVSGETHCIDEGCYLQDGHCVRTIHAEMNALLQCAKFGVQTDGAEIYVTHFPCLSCSKSLIQAGIKKINYLNDYRNDAYAIHLLEQSGVAIHQIKLPPQFFEKMSLALESNAVLPSSSPQLFENCENGDCKNCQ